MIQKLGTALKKMSQRAIWRGDRSQSEMIENHGLFGMRSNMLHDTPSYKKEGIGFNTGDAEKNETTLNQNKSRKNGQNLKNTVQVVNSTTTKLGDNILDALK